jgi:hypothetical protein
VGPSRDGLLTPRAKPGTNQATTRGIENPASLSEAGIDKNLAKRARQIAAIGSRSPAPARKSQTKPRRQSQILQVSQQPQAGAIQPVQVRPK